MEQKELLIGPLPIEKLKLLTNQEIGFLEGAWGACRESFNRRFNRKPIEAFSEDFVNPSTRKRANKSTMSVWINQQLPRAANLILEIERATRMPCITQWLAYQHGFQLAPREISNEERVKAENEHLKAELERLKAGEEAMTA